MSIDSAGRAVWTIPLTVAVDLGHGGPSGVTGAEVPVPTAPISAPRGRIDEQALGGALARIGEHTDEPYFDEESDRLARDEYYPDLDELEELDEDALFETLHRLLRDTHTTELSYKSARLDHLYPWVDLREDRELRSIYSNKGFAPEEIIRLDLEVEAFREAMIRERLRSEAHMDSQAFEELLDDLEAQAPFNCEHVVPQSWFGKAQPMKADLHHLFTCESGCNSFRQNLPYFEFSPEEEAVRSECGRREGTSKFEPDAGKGVAARATLYFLLRYPNLIGDEARELQAERLTILLDWHSSFPVETYERHRNAEIFEVQGNRNPLIDVPGLADQIDFSAGFGFVGD